MDISQVTTVEMHGSSSGSGHRKRPPKLKSVDRTVSVVVDNYTPLPSAAFSARNAGPLVINMDLPPPTSSRRSSPNISDDIFRHNQSSSSIENAMICNEDYPHQSNVSIRKSSSFRRGETIDMMDLPSTMSTSLQHLRKTPSFHSPADEENNIQIVPLSRHYSVRHHTHPTTPSTFKSFVHQAYQQQKQQEVTTTRGGGASSSTRRNCSMHRSFHEPHKRSQQSSNKREIAVKSNSFSSDEQVPPVQFMYQQQQHSSMQFPTKRNSSVESELYRSRSNSRSNSQVLEDSQQFLDVWKPSPHPSPQPGHSRRTPSPRPSSSNSLDQVLNHPQQQPQTLSQSGHKMLRHQHTIAALNPQFLAPIPLLALDKSFENVYQVKSPVFDMKKSYSLKYKNGPSGGSSKENRELFKSRKSKSFITDNDPLDVPFTLSPKLNLSPAALSASGSIKKHHSPMISPLPQSRNKMLLEEIKRRSGDGADDLLPSDPTGFPMELGGLDFNTVYKSYRAQQKVGRRQKNRRKKSSSSFKNEDSDSESTTKRKKVVCIVMAVFLILVVLSVLAVIVTLTHASSVQVQNQTRPVYTFSRDSRPIHYSAGGGGN